MTHTTTIQHQLDDDSWSQWRWVCSCGAQGRWQWQSDSVAKLAADKHRARHSTAPEALRRLLTLEW